jgi:hypothetical protein
LLAEHLEKSARVSGEQVDELRRALTKCPRELINTPLRCASLPPVSAHTLAAGVPQHRLRAWFHLRGQQIEGASQEDVCSDDEERYKTFSSRMRLVVSDPDEHPIGLDDSTGISQSFMRGGSLPPSTSIAQYAGPSLQTLQTWYHLSHGHIISRRGSLDPPVTQDNDNQFIRFTLRLGMDMTDLEDMDLPVVMDFTNYIDLDNAGKRSLTALEDHAGGIAPEGDLVESRMIIKHLNSTPIPESKSPPQASLDIPPSIEGTTSGRCQETSVSESASTNSVQNEGVAKQSGPGKRRHTLE